MNILVLIQLLLAHVINDFVIQPDHWVKKKKEKGLRSAYFWLHIILSGVITYVILMQWTNWRVPLFILVTHGLIDLWKIRKEKMIAAKNALISNEKEHHSGSVYYFIDQLLHLVVIFIAWMYATHNFDLLFPTISEFFANKNTLTILTAFILIVWPAGTSIEKITEPFRNELSANDSLRNAGTYIGVLERILILISIFTGQYAVIGFLIAGKSILRVSRDSDADARKKTEYVLIGTLLSFTVAIGIGLLAKAILNN